MSTKDTSGGVAGDQDIKGDDSREDVATETRPDQDTTNYGNREHRSVGRLSIRTSLTFCVQAQYLLSRRQRLNLVRLPQTDRLKDRKSARLAPPHLGQNSRRLPSHRPNHLR